MLGMLEAFGDILARRRTPEELERERQRCLAHAVPWDDLRTKFSKDLVIVGDSYDMTPYRWLDTPALTPGTRAFEEAIQTSPDGLLGYANALVPADTWFGLAQGGRRGHVRFTTPVVSPTVYYRRRANHPWEVWMGAMPMELMTQRQGVRLATGKVLIGGLGLGWLLWQVARKKSVTEIVLVEINEQLLDWQGEAVVERVRQATGKRITVIRGDVLGQLGRHGADTRHLVDIWDAYGVSLPREWRAAVASVKHFWGWGINGDS